MLRRYKIHQLQRQDPGTPLFDQYRDALNFGEQDAVDALRDGDAYEMVAEFTCNPRSLIEGDGLEEAYRRTQNGLNEIYAGQPDNWVEGNGITAHGRTGARSTSVGDIIEEDGVLYVCSAIGFKRLTDEPTEKAATLRDGVAQASDAYKRFDAERVRRMRQKRQEHAEAKGKEFGVSFVAGIRIDEIRSASDAVLRCILEAAVKSGWVAHHEAMERGEGL